MALTYQAVVDMARIPLNDADKTRYTDIEMMGFANQAMLQAVKRRPDLFIGQYSSLPDGESTLTDLFPLGPGYLQMVADYTVGRAEMVDDEHANTGRAAIYGNLFDNEAPL